MPMVPNPIYSGPVYETVTNISQLPNQNLAPPSPYGNIPLHPAPEPCLDSKFTHFNPEAALQCNEDVAIPTDIIPSCVIGEDNYTVMRSPTSTVPPVWPQPAEHENITMRYVQDPTVTDLWVCKLPAAVMCVTIVISQCVFVTPTISYIIVYMPTVCTLTIEVSVWANFCLLNLCVNTVI